ncbi:hypothetical protein V8F63_02555 [Brevundimonas sp. LF-1]|uniref:hypothetical protein n=1 Tax=Brevundimonas sp. LF-1 TaxID=3126100 RepID=UPI0030E51935
MSKKSLYLASAALALFAAGNAYAIDVSGIGKYSTVNSAVTTSAAIKLASELRFTASASSASSFANSADMVSFKVSASTGNSLPTGVPLVLTVDLTNAVFNDALGSNAVLTGTGACTFSPAPLSGVQANAKSASYLLTLSGCGTATADGITVTLPVRATGAGSVSIGAELITQAGGLAVDGGRKAATFIQLANAFDVAVSASGSNAVADLAEGYEKLTSGNAAVVVGTYQLKVDTDVYTHLSPSTGSGKASTADVAAVRLKGVAAAGFNGFNLAHDTATATFGATTATIADTRVLDVTSVTTTAHTIYVVDNTGTATGTSTAEIIARNGIITPTALNLTATVDLLKPSTDTSTTTANPFNDFSKSADLKSVVRNGASFVAPWVALGSSSANSTIRLANNGAAATGPIQVTLLSHNGTSVTTKTVTIGAAQVVAGSLNATGGIAAGSAVSISGAALKAAFGTDAVNGDLQVSVEGHASTLSGKVRVTQASGQIFETSLGNIGN